MKAKRSVSSSVAESAISRKKRSIAPARTAGYSVRPPMTCATGCKRYSKRVTMPKFPPPLRSDEVVCSEAVLAHQPADAAAKRESSDAGGRDETAGGGEPVGVRRGVELAPGKTRLRDREALLRVDANASAAFTSAALVHRAMSVGRLSIIPFHTRRAVSYSG